MFLKNLETQAIDIYIERYISFFPKLFLKNKTVVFYSHSSVIRNILPQILQACGCKVIEYGRSDSFVAIDTENVTEEQLKYFKNISQKFQKEDILAIISTDGDGDRPFLIDEKGVFHRGDIVGYLCSGVLGIKHASIPITSNPSILELLNKNNTSFTLTKIGSPHVIRSMNNALADGKMPVAGWEVNGGFLTATETALDKTKLSPLPTRDAILPILAILYLSVTSNKKISAIFNEIPAMFSQAGLLDKFPTTTSKAIIDLLTPEKLDKTQEIDLNNKQHASILEYCSLKQLVESFFTKQDDFTEVNKINYIDGIRVSFSNKEIVHIRPSGNSPQLRVYSCAQTQERADQIVDLTIKGKRSIISLIENKLSNTKKNENPLKRSKGLKFGTSGLRGFISEMTDKECYINTLGFINYLLSEALIETGDTIYIAGDLRSSTDSIQAAVIAAINNSGCEAVSCGKIPTPALAYFASNRNTAAIMVTGSHIPDDQNGIKFYKPNSEILKSDEEAINKIIAHTRSDIENSGNDLFNLDGSFCDLRSDQ